MIKFNFLKTYTKLPRNVYILFIAGIINSAGSFVYPFLAMFLTIKLGFSEYFAGFLLTVIITAEGAGRLLGGKLADWIGRKIVIIISSLIGAGIFIVIAFIQNDTIIPYLIIIASFIKSAAFPAINALIIDATTRKKRNDAFSLLYMGYNIGFAIGPLAAGFLFINYIELIFLIDAITTILALIPIIFLVKETLQKKTGIYFSSADVSFDEKAEVGNVIKIFFRKPVLWAFSLISIIFSFVYVQTSFSLPLYLENIFVERGPRFYGILMTINAIIVILLTLFIITALKKINPILNISMAGILFALGFGMLFFSNIYLLFIISTFVWTLGEIINSVSSNVLVANYSPVTHRGRFNAIFYFISGIGFALGPLLMGVYIRYFGLKQVWPFVFVLSIFASFMMVILFFIERKKKVEDGLLNGDEDLT